MNKGKRFKNEESRPALRDYGLWVYRTCVKERGRGKERGESERRIV